MLNINVEDVRKEMLKGENMALETFYIKCKSYCQNYLRKNFKMDNQEFNDLYIDALLVLRKNIIAGKLNSFNSLNSYILTICINLKKKKNTESSRIQKKSEEIKLLYYQNDPIEFDTPMISNNGQRAKTSLEQLSEKCQKILIAYYVHNLSMKEIASELDFSSSDVAKTTKMRCHKKWIEYFNSKS
jgi:RNA polymerase sigma factor (sigma-70 family)